MKPQKKTIHGPVLRALAEGQLYIDEPVYKQAPVYCANEPMTGNVLRYYIRTPLRWIKPSKSLP